MAVYFPRGRQNFKAIEDKFGSDLADAKHNSTEGIAFVTNQELTLSLPLVLSAFAVRQALSLAITSTIGYPLTYGTSGYTQTRSIFRATTE
jgi:hypothetical protein